MKSRVTGRRDNLSNMKGSRLNGCDPWFYYMGVNMGVKSTEKPYEIYVYLCTAKPLFPSSNLGGTSKE